MLGHRLSNPSSRPAAALAGELDGHLDREAVRGLEDERLLAADRVLLHVSSKSFSPRVSVSPNFSSSARSTLAMSFLGARRALIHAAHLLHHDVRELRQEALELEVAPVDDGAANDPPQDVAAALVRGRDPVRDEEGHGAPVVGEDAVSLRGLVGFAVARAGLGGDPVHDVLEAVRLVHRDHALEDRRTALDPQPRVDVLPRQRRERSVLVEVEFHEDEVPELEEAVALAAGCAVRPVAAVLAAAVEVELGAGPAGTGRPGLPEVLGAREPHDALGRDPDPLPGGDGDGVLAQPEVRVAREDGRPENLGVEPHVLRDELPGQVDGAVLEVLADREVPQHLEEGQMPRSQAHHVDVRRPEALLHGRKQRRGRLLGAEEVGLQRLHPGRGQEHGRVVRRRHERCRRPPEVSLRLEVGEKASRSSAEVRMLRF